MSDHVYKTVEITGSSKMNAEDAIKNAISTAAKTIRNMEWFVVTETRGHIKDGAVGYYQVTLKIGFKLEA